MSSPQVRQRQGQKDKKAVTPPSSQAGDLNGILKDTKLPEAVKSEMGLQACTVDYYAVGFYNTILGNWTSE